MERMKTYPLAPDGVFWTLQGEGALQGEPMAFVRLAGCSVGCAQCDTDYRVSRRLTCEEIVEEVRAVVPPAFVWPWVWITGGEPTDHDLAPLVDIFHTLGFRVALATSGVRPVTVNVDWLSVSPHRAELRQQTGHELKVVPGLNGLTLKAATDFGRLSFAYKFIQPMWWETVGGPEADGSKTHESMIECREFVLANPGWRLTTQAHKTWGLK
jgi:7-carboxy-7-deazaguanine synthase